MMTAKERRLRVREKYRSIIGRNLYSQSLRDYCYRKYKDGKYYSDCSSSICYTYREVGEDFGILNTVGMWESKKLADVDVKIRSGVIQNPEALRIGDMLLFAGTDSSRSYAGYVGHVEMVGEISGSTIMLYGHGSGNPKSHEMNAYCKSRYSSKTSTKVGNKGLIRVRRFITDDPEVVNDMATGYIIIGNGSWYVRAEPDKKSNAFCVVRTGEKLIYLGKTENGWNKVYSNGYTGWISSKAGAVNDVAIKELTVKAGNWYIRSAPGSSASALGTVKGGEKIRVVDEKAENGWYLIEYQGKNAYISTRAVEK